MIHTTDSAARFLGVSPATVRRLSDAGLLPVQRIGGRGVRRFAESDLLRLKKGGLLERITGSPGRVTIRGTAIPLHTHLPVFYETDASRLNVSLAFLRDGLLGGQTCFLVASDAVRVRYVDALGSDVNPAVREAADHLLLREREGGPDQAIREWEKQMSSAMSRGTSLIRVVGEMGSWRQSFGSDEAMLEYERALDAVVKRFPSIFLCQFDVREFSGTTVIEAFKSHPDVFKLNLANLLA